MNFIKDELVLAGRSNGYIWKANALNGKVLSTL